MTNCRAHFGRAFVLTALAGAWTVGPASATTGTLSHEPPDPDSETLTTDAELNDESVQRELDGMRSRSRPGQRITTEAPSDAPADSGAKPKSAGAFARDGVGVDAKRLREGAFVSRRPGVMLKAPTGDWIFIPNPTADTTMREAGRTAAADRPMVVLPSQMLEKLEASIGEGQDRPAVMLSGQVFSYRGREYLLTQQPSSVRAAVVAPAAAVPASPAGTDAPDEPSRDPSVRELIAELESRRSGTRALTPGAKLSRDAAPTASSSPAGTADRGPEVSRPSALGGSAAALVPEGTLVTSRRGRVTRLPGGDLAFSFDNDAQSASDGPMALLPSATLQRIESLVQAKGDTQTVELSGRVMSYGGRNYLMPTMYVVPMPSEIKPLQ